MEKVVLTRGRIEDAQPADKPYRIWDAKVPGLFLRVQPSGAKLWNVQWSRTTSKSLGKYPALTLDGARTRALTIMNDASLNGVPEAAKKKPTYPTLRTFLADDYGPWARTHLKRGGEAVERIERIYADLLPLQLTEIDGKAVEAARTAAARTAPAPPPATATWPASKPPSPGPSTGGSSTSTRSAV